MRKKLCKMEMSFVEIINAWKFMCSYCKEHNENDYCGTYCGTPCGFEKPYGALDFMIKEPKKFELAVNRWLIQYLVSNNIQI